MRTALRNFALGLMTGAVAFSCLLLLSAREVFLDTKESAVQRLGPDAVPALSPGHLRSLGLGEGIYLEKEDEFVFPLGGVPSAPTVFCREEEGWQSYVSDPFGFANDPARVTAGQADLVILGDSWAQGYCVPPENRLANSLNRLGKSTLSFGVFGTGPLAQL